MPTIQQLAAALLDRATRTKSDRTPGLDSYIVFEEREPWEDDLCRDAHGVMFPDNWRYEFICDALSIIAETDEDATDDDISKAFDEWFDGAYVYTSERTGWLHSRVDRYGYVDEAIEELGKSNQIIDAIACGMYFEAREVFWSVLYSLREKAEEEE